MALDLKLSPRDLPAPPVPPPGPAAEDGTSLWRDAWHRLRKNRMAVVCLFGFLFVAAASYGLAWLHPWRPDQQTLSLGASPPLARIVSIEDMGSNRPPRFVTLERLQSPVPGQTERVRENRRNRPMRDEELAAVTAALAAGAEHRVGDSVFRLTDRMHLLGTDQLGRDLLARVLQGGRVSLGVGFAATLVSVLIGVLYGAIAAYAGGKTDAIMMRLVDILYALPFTIFVIVLMTVLQTRSLVILFVAIGAVEWLTMARIVRGQAMSVKRMEFIEAAQALGLGSGRIVLRHIVPNVLGPVIVFSTLTVPAVMLLEAALSFLGLGVQPPNASWGVLIKEGAESMTVFPWLLLFPALVFSATLFCLNFLGDGLRDALDVKASKD